ncbi:MAG: methyltransferase domain-containing protein [Spirochaetota bacterium]
MSNGNQKSYTWDSEDYAKQSEAQYKWAKELTGKLNLKGSESVLDIGCGDGKVTALLCSYLAGGSVTGIDSSADMIALAKKNHPPEKYPELFFIKMDATRLDFENKFDIAFSNAVLHWIKDQAAVLDGVKKSLKQSGRILFQMGGKGNAQDIIEVAHKLMEEKQWAQYFKEFVFPYNFPAPDEYCDWLQQADLELVRAELIRKDMTQHGAEGLAGWFRTTWMPYTDRIPKEKQDDFIHKTINLYLQKFPLDECGLAHVSMVRLEVEAVKLQ